MNLPISYFGNNRNSFSINKPFDNRISPQQIQCTLGPCINGKRLHICRKQVCTYYQTGHIFCTWVTTHVHYHSCGIVLPLVSVFKL